MTRFNNIISLDWSVGHALQKTAIPEKFVPATVPGAVQLDIARAEGYPDLNFADNYKQYGWMEDCFYTYRTQFDAPKLAAGETLWFISKGIDYQCEIRLNGVLLAAREGMFSAAEVDLSTALQPNNLLEVLLWPAPKRHPEPADRTQASNVAKPAVSYEWDWHPRLIPLGIWDQTGLQIRQQSYLTDVYVNYTLNDALSSASIRIAAEGVGFAGYSCKWSLRNRQGLTVATAEGLFGAPLCATLDKPELWWTHDHGTPYLYTSNFEVVDAHGVVIESWKEQIGFRRIKLIMNEGTWSEPVGFPKSRSAAPAQIELNGRAIFAKGSNWVCPEIFPGIITPQRYEELLDIALQTNFNILRSWGGGIINKDEFFELCDQKGLLVWQEFPLACNCYPDDPHYLEILEQEATAIIRRLRRHPSMAIWCGGNELFNSWSAMTDQSLPLRLLNALCYRLSPEIPFNATSPLNGMAHGHYVFRWEGVEVYKLMNKSHYTAYTEFGMPGISPREVLEKIIPAEELFPPKAGTAWQDHHAFGAWDGDPATWLSQHILTRYFGEARSLDELIDQSSLVQSEGYKAIFEEARRQKPYCAMALNWCFDEPWPSAANNSLVVYPAVKKPALDAVRCACRPTCASARLSKFRWTEGEEFFADIWMLNDSFKPFESFNVKVSLRSAEHSELILNWQTPAIESNRNIAGPTARYRMPSWDTDRFTVAIQVEGHPEMDAEYTLPYRRLARKEARTASMNVTE